MLAWFLGAVIGHDLLLMPLYSLADRSVTAAIRHREPELPVAPWINYVRVPAALSGLLLLVWFPLILRLRSPYHASTTLSADPYVWHWLAVTGALFLLSAVAFALRLRGRPHTAPPPERPAPAPAGRDSGQDSPGSSPGQPRPAAEDRDPPGPLLPRAAGPHHEVRPADTAPDAGQANRTRDSSEYRVIRFTWAPAPPSARRDTRRPRDGERTDPGCPDRRELHQRGRPDRHRCHLAATPGPAPPFGPGQRGCGGTSGGGRHARHGRGDVHLPARPGRRGHGVHGGRRGRGRIRRPARTAAGGHQPGTAPGGPLARRPGRRIPVTGRTDDGRARGPVA